MRAPELAEPVLQSAKNCGNTIDGPNDHNLIMGLPNGTASLIFDTTNRKPILFMKIGWIDERTHHNLFAGTRSSQDCTVNWSTRNH